jgi:membrane-bound metal-dependent hydrolase YbcI (DUF457 family)
MFIGHYALGFAAKRIDKLPSLGLMFMAVQWPDLIWPILVLTGVERVSIEPGNTVLTPLNFEHYPWSHSLLMVGVWAFLFGIVYFIFSKNRKGALLLAFLVVSHWLLDWLTHRPDLPLSPFSEYKTGLGLWNHKWPEIILETGLFFLGALLYFNSSRPKNKTGTWAVWGLVIFLLAIHFMNIFGPPPPSVNAIAWAGLLLWLLVIWGFWIDKNRS